MLQTAGNLAKTLDWFLVVLWELQRAENWAAQRELRTADMTAGPMVRQTDSLTGAYSVVHLVV